MRNHSLVSLFLVLSSTTASAQNVIIDFDSLPAGTTVTNQFPEATFSTASGEVVQTTTASPLFSSPNVICATQAGPFGSTCGDGPITVDFTSPAENLTFSSWTGSVVSSHVASVDVFENGSFSATVQIISDPSGLPTVVDLTAFHDVTRITVFVPTGFIIGVYLDDFSFCVSNDDCACAEPISGTGTFAFDNTAATTDGAPDALCDKFGSSQIDSDVWFEWTSPACGGDYVVRTCALTDVDTRLAVYEGDDCATATILDCNDDICDLQSEVGFTAQPSTSYLIRVGTFPGASGGVGEIQVDGSAGPGNYCGPNTNFSTGFPSTISAPNGLFQSVASGTGAGSDFVLEADNLPAQFGIFIAGVGQDNIPFFNGMNGALCIDIPTIQRLGSAPDIPVGGVSSLTFDLDAMVFSAANPGTLFPLGVAAGESYNFQRWNRDPAGGGGNANFSDGINICFVP